MTGEAVITIGAAVVALAGVYWSSRHAWWKPSAAWSRPRVLMYHMVRDPIPGARFNKLRVPPDVFEEQVAWLKERGFTFVFASELAGGDLPERSVCLTFDDGYADNLLAADPVLERYGAKATLYLVGERDAGWSSKKKAHHGDEELAGEPKLSDEQTRAMVASGRWELGGHTRTHANLLALDEREAREEIEWSRRAFPERFGVEAETFAYPFGLFNDRHAALVREAGYTSAVTTTPGIPERDAADLLRVPRVKVSGKEGMFDFVTRVRTGMRGWRK